MTKNSATALVKMSTLARLSGVPAATIKHYLREELLPEPSLRRSKNSALYDTSLVERVKAIKELQRTHFLPLRVIKGVLDGAPPDVDEATARAIRRVLDETSPSEVRTRKELLAAGMPEEELALFEGLGLVTADRSTGEDRYAGDDLALLQTLGAARRAGITTAMLPAETLRPYAKAMRALVRAELEMFREGVLPRAGRNLVALTEVATKLSERLVVLLRRKLLLPTLQQLVAEARPQLEPQTTERKPPKAPRRTKPAPSRKKSS